MSSPPLIICVLLPRLALAVAVGSRREDLLGVPAALAPEAGKQTIGEVSAAAEAFGIKPGMRLGEALSRCPTLTLVPPDPAGVAERWEELLIALESIGAAVEPGAPGIACFDARGLLRLHGGHAGLGADGGQVAGLGTDRDHPGLGADRGHAGLGARQREALRGPLGAVLAAARQALGAPAKFGVAPTRFAAVAAAHKARARRPLVITGGQPECRQFLAPLEVDLLRSRHELAALPDTFERLGIATLGELANLDNGAVADRFGSLGVLAQRLARGLDLPLRPRTPGELVRETLDLPEAADGPQLERVIGVLVDRLLARRERRGRSLRAVVLSAALVEGGGTWHQQVTFRESLTEASRMRLALTPRLGLLPAPATSLTLAVERFGPVAGAQGTLLEDPAEVRAGRLGEAVRQARTVAGPEAALRILPVDPDSRLPERRSVLTPFEG
jgi:protein ImuB